MNKFEVGKTYRTRSTGDHNCIISETIVSRTKKTVKTQRGKTFRVKPDYYGENECFYPWGKHSMCPIMKADATRELKADWEQ